MGVKLFTSEAQNCAMNYLIPLKIDPGPGSHFGCAFEYQINVHT
jgi:hypothetical protein